MVVPAKESPPAASRCLSCTPLSSRRRSAPPASQASEPLSAAPQTRWFQDVEPCGTGLHRCMDGLLREDGTMPQTVPVRVVPRCLTQLWHWWAALLVALALSPGIIIESQAATTWTVCASGCDYPRIKAAIAAPTTLDGDTLAIAAGVYTEPGILVDKSLTLQGEAAATTIVQAATTRGTAVGRVFVISSGVRVTLQNLTIRYGQTTANGGGLFNNGR